MEEKPYNEVTFIISKRDEITLFSKLNNRVCLQTCQFCNTRPIMAIWRRFADESELSAPWSGVWCLRRREVPGLGRFGGEFF